MLMRGLATVVVSTVFFGVLLFVPAGRWDLPLFWAYLAANLVIGVAGMLLMAQRSPDLIKHRLQLGASDVPDRLYRLTLGLGLFSHYVIAGLDAGRFHWSGSIPLPVQLVGLLGYIVGVVLSTWAEVSNPFFIGAVRIQEERGHHVITTGPYQFVRHPGYAGGLVFMLFSGVALGSWWSILPMVLTVATLVRRTALEDSLLQQKLKGYADYAQKVRFRLIPGLW
jgi:protein-S-isoprenylcysteine O-methyltransferase Ste14